jgi:hypothetical protein
MHEMPPPSAEELLAEWGMVWRVSPLVVVFVRSDIGISALRTRRPVEVGGWGRACTGRTGVDHRRTCLEVIIAGTVWPGDAGLKA